MKGEIKRCDKAQPHEPHEWSELIWEGKYGRGDVRSEHVCVGIPEATLQGATDMPDEGRRVANAGEFAAAWNARTDQQREDLVVQLLHQQDTSIKCFQQDHDSLLEQLRAVEAKRNEWIVLYWHEECVECEGHAESAITYAQVTGSVGMTHQETEVIPYDRAGDPTFKPAIAHGAKVRRAV